MPTQLTLAGVRPPRSLARSPWRREIDDDRGEEEKRRGGSEDKTDRASLLWRIGEGAEVARTDSTSRTGDDRWREKQRHHSTIDVHRARRSRSH